MARDLLFASNVVPDLYFGIIRSCALKVMSSGIRPFETSGKGLLKLVDYSENTTNVVIEKIDSYLESNGSKHGLFSAEQLEVMQLIKDLLCELRSHIDIDGPVKLVKGMGNLMKKQDEIKLYKRRNQMRRNFFHTSLSHETRYDDAELHLKYAVSTYGKRVAYMFGMIHWTSNPLRVYSDDNLAIKSIGLEDEDILVHVQNGEIYLPGHFVAVNHERRHVVVSIWGTKQFHDILVDLNFIQKDVMVVVDGIEYHGNVHRGMWMCAERLPLELKSLVQDALESHAGYSLVVTGHSMGAGVATLLTLQWHENNLFAKRNLHCFALAAPCVLCYKLVQLSILKKSVSSFVLGDDVLSRLSFSTVKEMGCSIARCGSDADIVYELIEDKLWPGGAVWLLNAKEFECKPQRIDPVEYLQSIQVNPSMIFYQTG